MKIKHFLNEMSLINFLIKTVEKLFFYHKTSFDMNFATLKWNIFILTPAMSADKLSDFINGEII